MSIAPLRVRMRDQTFREPDVVVLLDRDDPRRENRYWRGADLVVEIVSEGEESHQRDWIDKKRDYALAGISEYWVVDLEQKIIAVFTLPAGSNEYKTHGEFKPGAKATSVLLKGFAVDVQSVFDAAKDVRE